MNRVRLQLENYCLRVFINMPSRINVNDGIDLNTLLRKEDIERIVCDFPNNEKYWKEKLIADMEEGELYVCNEVFWERDAEGVYQYVSVGIIL